MSADKESSLLRKWPLTETGRRGEQGPRKNVTEARQHGEAGLADASAGSASSHSPGRRFRVQSIALGGASSNLQALSGSDSNEAVLNAREGCASSAPGQMTVKRCASTRRYAFSRPRP